MTLTGDIADFVADFSQADLPDEALAFARTAVTDLTAVMLAAASEPAIAILSGGCRPVAEGATALLDDTRRFDPADAARISGTAAHALDYDDVNAVHSSSMPGPDGAIYMGGEAGFMISGEGKTIYVSGDTDVMADMKIFNDLHAPDIGILSAGGHFTMDMKRAVYAARTFFDFKMVTPYHYKTFPVLAQNADDLIAGLPGVDVRTPEVLEAIEV